MLYANVDTNCSKFEGGVEKKRFGQNSKWQKIYLGANGHGLCG